MVKVETREVFTTAIEDVEADINGKSNAHLMGIAKNVKAEYERDPNASLFDIAKKYGIVEINVVSAKGIIQNPRKLTA